MTLAPISRASVAIGAALLLTGTLAAARQDGAAKAPVAPAAPAAAKQPRMWTIEYEEAVHSDKTGEGSAKVVKVTTDEGTVLHSLVFTWNDKTKIAKASGDLTMTDPQADATATEAEIQYAKDKKLVIMTGAVHVTLKPKEKEAPAAGGSPAPAPAAPGAAKATEPAKKGEPGKDGETAAEARRHPVDVTCERLEYSYARTVKHAVLTGSFKAVQKLSDKTRTLYAEKAEWFGVEEKVILRGPVHWEDTKGQKGDTNNDVTIYTKEGDERLQTKGGKITMPVDDEEEKPAAGAGGEKGKMAPPPEQGGAPPAEPGKDKTPPPGGKPG